MFPPLVRCRPSTVAGFASGVGDEHFNGTHLGDEESAGVALDVPGGGSVLVHFLTSNPADVTSFTVRVEFSDDDVSYNTAAGLGAGVTVTGADAGPVSFSVIVPVPSVGPNGNPTTHYRLATTLAGSMPSLDVVANGVQL